MTKIHISQGNTKIGKTLNISLPPGKTCLQQNSKPTPCYYDGCYARQSFKQYPPVRHAWSENLKAYEEDPVNYFSQICTEIGNRNPNYFRWHVGGDIPDQKYLDGMVSVARIFPAIQFLAFTKKYDLDYMEVTKYPASNNLKIVFSVWSSMGLPENKHEFPLAWLSHDPRIPKDKLILHCPGQCEECRFSCWVKLDSETDVVFDKH